MNTTRAKEGVGAALDARWQVGGRKMKPKIDYRKLLDQEPEVADFFKEVLFKVQASGPDFNNMAKLLYGLYQGGYSPDEVVKILNIWKR